MAIGVNERPPQRTNERDEVSNSSAGPLASRSPFSSGDPSPSTLACQPLQWRELCWLCCGWLSWTPHPEASNYRGKTLQKEKKKKWPWVLVFGTILGEMRNWFSVAPCGFRPQEAVNLEPLYPQIPSLNQPEQSRVSQRWSYGFGWVKACPHSPVSKRRYEVEAAVHPVVHDVPPVQPALIVKISLKLIVNVLDDGLETGQETFSSRLCLLLLCNRTNTRQLKVIIQAELIWIHLKTSIK